MKRSTKIIIAAVAVLSLGTMILLPVAAVLGKASHDSNRSRSSSSDRGGDPEYEMAVEAAGEEYTEYGTDLYTEDLSYSAGIDNTVSDKQYQGTDNKIIRTVTMSFETENFDEMNSLVRDKVVEYGGYFETLSINGTGVNEDYRNASYTIRVPSEKLDQMIASLNGMGTVVSTSESSEDVTLDYVDMESHLEALRAEQDALLEMLQEATELETIIVLQDELSNIRYEIEYYESSVRTIDNQVTYSTLYLYASEVIVETPVIETRTQTFGEKLTENFKESVNDIKEGAKCLILNIASALPHIILFLIFASLIFLIVLIIVKVMIKKRKKKLAAIKTA